jgi:four helix bundle protein
MAHDATDLRVRTKKFALQIIKLYQNLPHSGEAQVIGKQILRSGTSVGAQYREACRGKSPADFVNMMGGSLKELDETAYWLELLREGEIIPVTKLADLQKETDELIAIFVSSINTSKRNHPK